MQFPGKPVAEVSTTAGTAIVTVKLTHLGVYWSVSCFIPTGQELLGNLASGPTVLQAYQQSLQQTYLTTYLANVGGQTIRQSNFTHLGFTGREIEYQVITTDHGGKLRCFAHELYFL